MSREYFEELSELASALYKTLNKFLDTHKDIPTVAIVGIFTTIATELSLDLIGFRLKDKKEGDEGKSDNGDDDFDDDSPNYDLGEPWHG